MFTRLFFHNRYDKSSIQQLATLPTDGTVKVYDVFGADSQSLPQNITLSRLPYLVDKTITLITPSPYSVGTLDLKFNCLDYQGNLLTTENSTFHIYINGDRYDDTASNGVIDLSLTISQPMSIDIEIKADTYLPFSQSIEVN